jgi:penicillin-binding protein 2
MESSHGHAGHRRARSALGIMCLVLAALGAGFFQLQIVSSPARTARAEGARLQAVPLPAARGVIVDRHGALLAEDVAAYAVSILPGHADSVTAVLHRLAPRLGIPAAEVESLLERSRAAPDQPLLVSRDLPPNLVAAIEADPAGFRGAWAGVRHKRRYPAGPAAAHVVGMLGEAEPSELHRPEFRAARTGALVGRAGVERQYERHLAGKGGLTYVRIDGAGRVLGPVATHPGLAPTPGQPLQLTMDLALQKRIAELVPAVARAGVAAIEPATGAVLALYSSPSFDPNLPDGPALGDAWATLRDDPAIPLLNRAIGSAHAPGFPWAVTTAATALRLGIIDGETRMPMSCRGGMPYGERYFRCADPRGHGSLTLVQALHQSCHVYFHQVALQLGLERVLEAGTRAGLGRATGIDIPGENAGIRPAVRAGRGRASETESMTKALELSTGNGPAAVTALQMARLYAAVAGGAVAVPRVVVDDGAPSGETLALGLDETQRALLLEGLGGGARSHGMDSRPGLTELGWSAIAGRSGSPGDAGHHWFVGVGHGPSRSEIVVVVMMEGRASAATARHIAAGAVGHYLDGLEARRLASGT